MTNTSEKQFIGIARMAAYAGVAEICLLAAGLAGAQETARWVIALIGLVLGAVTIVAFYRWDNSAESRLKSERLVASLGVAALCAAAVAVNLDGKAPIEPRLRESVSSSPSSSRDDIVTNKKTPEKMPSKETQAEAAALEEKRDGPQMPPKRAREVDALLVDADKAIKAKKLDEAEPLLMQAVEMIDQHAPKDLRERGEVVKTLARVRFAAGKKEEGMDALDQHILRLEQSGEAPEMIVVFHELAGSLLGNDNEFAESIDRFRQVLEIQMKSKAAPSVIAGTRINLAISHAKLDDKSTAKQELDRARELLSTAPSTSPETLQRLERVAREYGL